MENLLNPNEVYIGSGLTFPIELSQNELGLTGWYPVVGDTKLIQNNLESLISYQIGQRFREEIFGTRLWECIEEPNTQALNYLVDQFIKEAIRTWEDRITHKSTVVSRESSKLFVEYTYVINGTGSINTGNLEYDINNKTLDTK